MGVCLPSTAALLHIFYTNIVTTHHRVQHSKLELLTFLNDLLGLASCQASYLQCVDPFQLLTLHILILWLLLRLVVCFITPENAEQMQTTAHQLFFPKPTLKGNLIVFYSFSHKVVTMETGTIWWPPWLIAFIGNLRNWLCVENFEK